MKRIAIIGAGVSGLCAAKIFMKAGMNVSVFEKSNSVGGFWLNEFEHQINFLSTKKADFSFSDYKVPSGYPANLSRKDVIQYLFSYCKDFNLFSIIRFSHEVVNMNWNGSNWGLKIAHQDSEIYEVFDYVLICTGCPNTSKVVSESEFEGSISKLKLHTETELQVGNSKLNRNSYLPSLIFQKTVMPLKLFKLFLKPFAWFYLRALEFFVKNLNYLNVLSFESEKKLAYEFNNGFLVDRNQLIGTSELNEIELSASPFKFLFNNSNGVRVNQIDLDTEESNIQSSDSINLPFLSSEHMNILRDGEGNLRLYRNIINPEIPSLAFLGFNSSVFSPVDSEVEAYWVLALVKNQIELPSYEDMLESIRSNIQWRIKESNNSLDELVDYLPPYHHHLHLDELLIDMGLKTRKMRNSLAG
ncbi:NAD(P)-binding protein [Cytophagales bacterium LB-30]|uniref:NAD(P)-binding protein n=1 Tax=Shiella aurantiaca TaxID=3058365 RepID=A0ABT8F227_9BACT|nr:NAD(P)-binding protein [Shiella aurantiaca]MDN4164091.1 NAD(P)-binding protein [Shiella aurantiaca]